MSQYLAKWKKAILEPELPTKEQISKILEPHDILKRLDELEKWRDNIADPGIDDAKSWAQDALEEAQIAYHNAQVLVNKLGTAADHLSKNVENIQKSSINLKDTIYSEIKTIKIAFLEFGNIMKEKTRGLYSAICELAKEFEDSFKGINAGAEKVQAKIDRAMYWVGKKDIWSAFLQFKEAIEYLTFQDVPDTPYHGVLEEVIEAFHDLKNKSDNFNKKITAFGIALSDQVGAIGTTANSAVGSIAESSGDFANQITIMGQQLKDDLSIK